MTEVFRQKRDGIKARQVTYDPERQVVIDRKLYEYIAGKMRYELQMYSGHRDELKVGMFNKFLSAGEVER